MSWVWYNQRVSISVVHGVIVHHGLKNIRLTATSGEREVSCDPVCWLSAQNDTSRLGLLATGICCDCGEEDRESD